MKTLHETYIVAHTHLLNGDTQTALPLLETLAKEGDVEAMVLLGWAYLNGFGVPQNITVAKTHLSNAVAAGSVEGAFYIGRALGMEGNFSAAIEHYRLAAEHDYAPAWFRLGLAYRDGRGVGQDIDQAYKFLTLAATSRHRMAIRELALMELRGEFGLLRIPSGIVRIASFFGMTIADIVLVRETTEHVS